MGAESRGNHSDSLPPSPYKRLSRGLPSTIVRFRHRNSVHLLGRFANRNRRSHRLDKEWVCRSESSGTGASPIGSAQKEKEKIL